MPDNNQPLAAHEPLAEPERVRRALLQTRDAVARAFPGRSEFADAITHGLASREHVLTRGPRGTAKSAVLEAYLSGFSGVGYFALQFNAQTDVQDVVGPLSITALRDRDAREHNTAGYAPRAVVTYFDEVGKATGGTQNCLLSLLQERAWQGATCPLHSAFGATNEDVADESGAFKDRWLFHVPVSYITDDAVFFDVLRGQADGVSYVPPVALTHADLVTALAAVRGVTVRDETLRAVLGVRATLLQAGTEHSDRRWVKAITALRAAAYLAGDNEVDTEHFAVLNWVLGTTDEERARVSGVLKGFANGLYLRVTEVLDDALRAFAERGADYARDPGRVKAVWTRCKDAGREVQRLLGDPRKPGERTRSQARAADKVRPRMRELLDAVATIEREAASVVGQPDLSGWK